MIPSICKIQTKKNLGTGFLIKLYQRGQELFGLLTNEHVVQKEIVEKNESITISYNLEKNYININLNKSERFIECYKSLDITVIEIRPQDKIEEKYFLLPNLETNEFINKEIYIPQFAGGLLCSSEGMIMNIDKGFEIIHSAGTDNGSSGSPIFLKNSKKVIGIHKAGHKSLTQNYGTLISYLIQSLPVIEKKNYKLFYPNGEFYIGEIFNGLKNSKGIEYYKNGKIKYDGDWVIGKLEGNGKYFFEDDEFYIGQWKNNLRHGKGIHYYKNGNIKYDGDWVNDKFEGNGKFIYEDGEFYIGQWMNNLRNGKGIEYYKNSNIKYAGDWVNGKLEGYGKYIYEDGSYYIGQLMNNLRNGRGSMYYKNGKHLNNIWVNDKALSHKK